MADNTQQQEEQIIPEGKAPYWEALASDETAVTTPEKLTAEQKLEMRRAAVEKSQDELRAALEARMKPQAADPSELLWRISKAFFTPTATGSFGESLGNVAGSIVEQREAERKRREAQSAQAVELAKMRLELGKSELEQSKEATIQDLMGRLYTTDANGQLTIDPDVAKKLAGVMGKDEPYKLAVEQANRKVATNLLSRALGTSPQATEGVVQAVASGSLNAASIPAEQRARLLESLPGIITQISGIHEGTAKIAQQLFDELYKLEDLEQKRITSGLAGTEETKTTIFGPGGGEKFEISKSDALRLKGLRRDTPEYNAAAEEIISKLPVAGKPTVAPSAEPSTPATAPVPGETWEQRQQRLRSLVQGQKPETPAETTTAPGRILSVGERAAQEARSKAFSEGKGKAEAEQIAAQYEKAGISDQGKEAVSYLQGVLGLDPSMTPEARAAAQRDARKIFGILNTNKFADNLLNLMANGIQFVGGNISIPTIEDMARRLNATPDQIAKAESAKAIFNQLALLQASLLKGNFSDKDAVWVRSMGPGMSDPVKTLEMKTRQMQERINFNSKVMKAWEDASDSNPRLTWNRFKNSKAFTDIENLYLQRLRFIAEGKVPAER